MADNGVAAYWIFYRMHSELLKKRCISFKEPFEKRRFINDLWEEHKKLEASIAKAKKAAEEAIAKAKRAEKERANAEKERANAEQERANAEQEAKEAEQERQNDLDDIKVFVGAKAAKFAKK